METQLRPRYQRAASSRRSWYGSSCRLRIATLNATSSHALSTNSKAARRELKQRFSSISNCSAIAWTFDKSVAFAQAANAGVFILQHRLDDAENRFWPQVIAMLEPSDSFEAFAFVHGRSGLRGRRVRNFIHPHAAGEPESEEAYGY